MSSIGLYIESAELKAQQKRSKGNYKATTKEEFFDVLSYLFIATINQRD